LGQTERDLEALARRARRLGLPPPELRDTGRRERSSGVEYAHMVLVGETLQLAGWRLIAELRHGSGGTEVCPLADAEFDLEPWQEAPPRCEHCGVRRTRNTTYLIEHSSSARLAQVGSSCLADFTGRDPARVLRQASYLGRAHDLLGAAVAPRPPVDEESSGAIALSEYLSHAALLARLRGFTPIARPDEAHRATAELALENLRAAQGLGKPALAPERFDRERAGRALAWVRSELAKREKLSDYERKLVAVCSRERLRPHEVGLAASVLLAHEREAPVGPVGERVVVEAALLERVSPARQTRFGATFAHTFRDGLGRRIAWFATALKLAEGERYRLSGTVRRHDHFRGEPVTVLTRCRAEAIRADR